MKKIIICLFGDYHKDDRILKKAKSLSKFFKVTVIFITNKKYPEIENINENLKLKNIFIKSKIKLYIIRHFNFYFWKKVVINHPAEIYDCNDPDTMVAGIYAKKYWNSKIIYDSHELWSDVASKQQNLIKTIYSYISSFIFYFFYEKQLIKNFDKIITVSIPIKKKIEKNYYLNNVNVIYNFSNYDSYNNKIKKCNSIVFIGYNRFNIEKQMVKFSKISNLKPTIIGFKGNNPNIKYLGFLSKKEYRVKLKFQKIGLNYYHLDNDSLNCTSPNKIYQYLQANLPIISVNTLGVYHIKKHKIGETFNIKDENDFLKKVSKILNNYNYYIENIKKCKYELSWENQEKKLIKIYFT